MSFDVKMCVRQIFGLRTSPGIRRHAFRGRTLRQSNAMCESLESRVLLSADSLDSTFGTGGRAVTDFTDLSGSDDIVTAVRSLSDGKTLVAGNDNAGISWVSRYTATGQLDSTFGVGGKLATSLLIRANDVQVVPGGGILLAGEGFNGNDFDLAILKLTSTGDIDETFGNRGLALANFFNLTDTAHSVAIQGDGKILAAGNANNAGQLDFAIARFNPDGTLDNTYDTDGKQTVEFTNGQSNEARDVKLDPTSGKAVVAGFAFNGGDHNFAIARLTTQGGLDTTFDTDGKVTTDFIGGGTSNDQANSVVVSSTGIITAGGFATRADGKFDFALAQYNSNGTLRAGFDTDGRVTTDFNRGTPSDDKIGEIKLDSTGRIVAVGGTFEAGTPPREDFVMARYSANGAIDQTLGDGGLIYASFYANLGDQATALDIDSSGRWVVGGFTYNEFRNFAIGRFSPTDASLDSTFGAGGRTVTDFTEFSGTLDDLTAVRSLSNGKTIVVGGDFNLSEVAMYNSDGTLDNTFGILGKMSTSLLGGVKDVQVLSDGSILIAGHAFNGNNDDLAILKLTATGNLDETFGNRGLASVDFSGQFDEATSLAIQTDGRILAAGSTRSAGQFDFAVARFNTDGTLDTTYDTDGKQTVEFTNAQNNEAREVKLDPVTGKAVLAGYAFNGNNRNFAIARLTTQGGLDTTFDTDGKVTTDFGGNFDEEANSVVVSSTSIITAGGFAKLANGSFDFALAQYNSNGTLRSGFDTDGRVTTDFTRGTASNDRIGEIKLDSSGRIVAVGGTLESGTTPPREDFAMARYSANGAIDQTLGDGGLIYASFYANLGDQATALDIDSSGRWVVGGFTYNGFKNFAIGRFSPTDASLDSTFGAGGRVVTDFTELSGTRDTVTAVKSVTGGKTIVVGNDGNVTSWIARYNSNGTLDSTFGIFGKVGTAVLRGANDVQVLPDGSILIAGHAFNGSNNDLAILKLTSTGDVDETFGNRGLASADYFGFFDEATGLAIQTDGKILAAGSTLTSNVQTVTVASPNVPVPIADLTTITSTLEITNLAAIADINVQLNITHTFDGDLRIELISPKGTRILLSNRRGGSGDNFQQTIFDDASGTSIANGTAPFNGTFRPDVPLTVLNGESANGTWTLQIQDQAGVDSGTLNSWSLNVTARQFDFAAARFNTDGTLDTTYDADGKQTVEFTNAQNNEAREVKLDPVTGKAVLAGYAFNGSNRNFAIARLTTQGGLDTTFDTDGKVTTDFGGNFDEEANSVVVSSTSIITAGGFAKLANGSFDFDFTASVQQQRHIAIRFRYRWPRHDGLYPWNGQ